ncbi:hypothetical protein [Streptomyces sp. NPDC048551]
MLDGVDSGPHRAGDGVRRALSFQVGLRDEQGNTVRETITDAYRLAP